MIVELIMKVKMKLILTVELIVEPTVELTVEPIMMIKASPFSPRKLRNLWLRRHPLRGAPP